MYCRPTGTWYGTGRLPGTAPVALPCLDEANRTSLSGEGCFTKDYCSLEYLPVLERVDNKRGPPLPRQNTFRTSQKCLLCDTSTTSNPTRYWQILPAVVRGMKFCVWSIDKKSHHTRQQHHGRVFHAMGYDSTSTVQYIRGPPERFLRMTIHF
jgi:hypothetical protein